MNLFRITIKHEADNQHDTMHVLAVSIQDALRAIPADLQTPQHYLASFHDLGSTTNRERLVVFSDPAKKEARKL